MARYRAVLVSLLAVALLTACTGKPSPSPTATTSGPGAPAVPRAELVLPGNDTTVAAGATAGLLAIATSKLLFKHSPAVVLVGENDAASLKNGSATAADLGVPLLLTPASPAKADGDGPLRAELSRLAPATIVAVGAAAATWANSAAPPTSGAPTPTVTVSPGSGDDHTVLPAIEPAPPLDHLLVLALDNALSRAAVATAHAAGARVVLMDGPDPRTSPAAIKALTGQASAKVLALGSAFGSPDLVRGRIAVAATGVQLPGGGQVIFPGRRMVALYGHPGAPVLGVLGEQDLTATVARARTVAAAYSSLVKEPVVPAFEIIATVAAASAGPDGNYSNETPASALKPWVQAALSNGIYVVLDLQPGRSDFLSQAKLYADLLAYPNVGLALDPEWHMKSNQVPMEVIGSVDSSEINKTARWLADLTRAHNLPQKVFMVHQFRLDMITNRSAMETDFDQLQVVIHADGFGSTPQKYNTWNTLHINPPSNIVWGWKNFYDEDKPTLTPTQTMAVRPTPFYVSYQ